MAEEGNFGTYHRVLPRVRWSPMQISGLPLALLIAVFVTEEAVLVRLIDERLERRPDKQIVYKGVVSGRGPLGRPQGGRVVGDLLVLCASAGFFAMAKVQLTLSFQ